MGRTDSATLNIATSPAAVHRALLSAVALERWLPPAGMTGRLLEHDLRVGGSFRMELVHLDPSDSPGKTAPDRDVTEVRILEVVPDQRVVWQVEFDSADPALAGVMTMTWSYYAQPEATHVEVRADDVPPGIEAAAHRRGLDASLTNLAAYLAGS
ncbi:SRPBCC domain-containing protein [Nocardioides insulae]|uniref:SRPBCC domain-containing protein n=1 Tax=Nocardioides insulae TaxID=394734 RepID=UPI0003FE9EBC|nr:SRPBCC domain-containing protein [Nocardioides insulae]